MYSQLTDVTEVLPWLYCTCAKGYGVSINFIVFTVNIFLTWLRELDIAKDYQDYLDFIRLEILRNTRPCSKRKYVI